MSLMHAENRRAVGTGRKLVAPINELRLTAGLREILADVLPKDSVAKSQGSASDEPLGYDADAMTAAYDGIRLSGQAHNKGDFLFRFILLGGGGGIEGNGYVKTDSGSESSFTSTSSGYTSSSTSWSSSFFASSGKSPLGGFAMSVGGNVGRNIAMSADYQVILGVNGMDLSKPGFMSNMLLGPGLTAWAPKAKFFFATTVGWANLMIVRNYSVFESYNDNLSSAEKFLEAANGAGFSASFGFEFWRGRGRSIGFTLARATYARLFSGAADYNEWSVLTGLNITHN
jgi:hypothetical protein